MIVQRKLLSLMILRLYSRRIRYTAFHINLIVLKLKQIIKLSRIKTVITLVKICVINHSIFDECLGF